MLKQSTAGSRSELVYAATNFAANGSAGAITVKGEQPLVTIPLTLTGTDWNQLKVNLFYYKVVDKKGNVIAEFNLTDNPIEVPVQ
ncbi:hypothetical protein D3C73_1570560 [compost metagenome]